MDEAGHTLPCASTTRTRISPASSTTRATCASWSAAAPSFSAASRAISRNCTGTRRGWSSSSADGDRLPSTAVMDDELTVRTLTKVLRGASMTLAQDVRRGRKCSSRPKSRWLVSAKAGPCGCRTVCGRRWRRPRRFEPGLSPAASASGVRPHRRAPCPRRSAFRSCARRAAPCVIAPAEAAANFRQGAQVSTLDRYIAICRGFTTAAVRRSDRMSERETL